MTTSLHLALNHLKPIVHFLLYHTVHCTEKIVSACWRAGSSLAERVGQGKWVGSPTHMVVVVAGCRNGLIETGWAHVARKHYSHLSGRECSLGWERVLAGREC